MVVHSATLALNEQMEALCDAGRPGLHLGFGEAGLPVLPAAASVLAAAVERNSYAPVAGRPEAREAVAGYFTRRGMVTRPDQVLLGPGSKPVIYALLACLTGDVVLACPSWVSYAPQVELVGKRAVPVPIPEQAGGIPDPERLTTVLDRARRSGLNPASMVVTTPDNPTGTVPSAALVKEVCQIADRQGLLVISDEIYRDLAYDPSSFVSPAELLPERCIITGGLSKSMALGGWRVGFARLPSGDVGRELFSRLIGVASELWSSLADPMQAVAAYVMGEPDEVRRHVEASRRLHGEVAAAVHQRVVEAGARCRVPEGGFYLYPDFEPLRPRLEARGVTTGAGLCRLLLEEHGVGVLAGEAFGDAPEGLRFRAAVSLLYGESAEQRWQALASNDPVALPWIAKALDHLSDALGELGA